MDESDRLMTVALQLAALARDAGEVPIGAVVALDGEIVGRGFNQPIVRAIRRRTRRSSRFATRRGVGNYRLTGAMLCVTIEPCLMCVGAIVHARIGTLVYGAAEPQVRARSSRPSAARSCRGSTIAFEVVGGRSRGGVPRADAGRSSRSAAARRVTARAGALVRSARILRGVRLRDPFSTSAERYRSGRNGRASKACCRVTGTWVRIPPSPPYLNYCKLITYQFRKHHRPENVPYVKKRRAAPLPPALSALPAHVPSIPSLQLSDLGPGLCLAASGLRSR